MSPEKYNRLGNVCIVLNFLFMLCGLYVVTEYEYRRAMWPVAMWSPVSILFIHLIKASNNAYGLFPRSSHILTFITCIIAFYTSMVFLAIHVSGVRDFWDSLLFVPHILSLAYFLIGKKMTVQ